MIMSDCSSYSAQSLVFTSLALHLCQRSITPAALFKSPAPLSHYVGLLLIDVGGRGHTSTYAAEVQQRQALICPVAHVHLLESLVRAVSC